MTKLNRDQLLSDTKRPIETVRLTDKGGEILVRGITAGELMHFQKAISSKKNGVASLDEDTFAAKLLVRCIVDETGKRILQDDDWQALQNWPAADFQKATTVAMRLNGYGSAEGNV